MDEDIDEDIDYREFTNLELRNYNNFINSPYLIQFMVRYSSLIVGNYYVMKFKDYYDDQYEEPTIIMVGYFLGIDNRPNHIEALIFSINKRVTLEDYFSMDTHHSRIENGIYQAGIEINDEFFNMTPYLNFQNSITRRQVTQNHPSRRRIKSKSRSKSPKRKTSKSIGITRH